LKKSPTLREPQAMVWIVVGSRILYLLEKKDFLLFLANDYGLKGL
jgi:hypothetical protein